ncbi:MAG: type II secretion system major pseudopilin GspG [Chthoniobacteraceae bacterium]|jgi:general secretion pathway protein G
MISIPSKQSRAAFTLLEMMMVVMIIAMLLAAAIHYMGGNVGYAQEVRVKADIDSINTQLKLYQAMNGFLPTTEQGLQALVTRPDTDPKPTQWHQLMDKVPLDPWQDPYNYEDPGKHNPNTYDLYSSGADRKPGTPDDIGNWDDTSK